MTNSVAVTRADKFNLRMLGAVIESNARLTMRRDDKNRSANNYIVLCATLQRV